MRLPNIAHTARPRRIHALARDFRLEDVWALPTPGGPGDFPRSRGGARLTGMVRGKARVPTMHREPWIILTNGSIPRNCGRLACSSSRSRRVDLVAVRHPAARRCVTGCACHAAARSSVLWAMW